MKSFMILFLMVISTLNAVAEERLRVAVSEIPPCVLSTGDQLSGFSIDLWNAVASEVGIEYESKFMSFKDKLDSIQERAADVAIGCISMTSSRENYMDFTLPVGDGGFLAISKVDEGVLPKFSPQSKKMLWVLLGFVIFFSHLMWWSERGQDAINDNYFPGIFEAIWFSIVTMSTVGYGDISPKKWLGKISALLIILTGVTSFGVIFSQFAADAQSDQAKYTVTSIKDFSGYTVGTKSNTSAATYLKSRGVNVSEFININEAISELRKGVIQVVLYDAATIKYVDQKYNDLIQTGPLFNPHYYGIALQKDSDLKEPINIALLKIRESGLYDTIYNRWF